MDLGLIEMFINIASSLFALSRRGLLSILIPSTTVPLNLNSTVGHAVSQPLMTDDSSLWKLTLPLERYYGGTNCIRLSIPGKPQQYRGRNIRPIRVYQLIVDTGSPYLVIPNDLKMKETEHRQHWFRTIIEDLSFSNEVNNDNLLPGERLIRNLFDSLFIVDDDIENVPFKLSQSVYEPTQDIYGSQLGFIEWKQSSISCRNNRLVPSLITGKDGNDPTRSIVLGVLDEELTKESGGPLLGLVKNSKGDISTDKVQLRPTFLDQVRLLSSSNIDETEREITSFRIDSTNMEFTMLAQKEGTSLISDNAQNVINLCDLQSFGDFVDHYAFFIDKLSLNNGEQIITSKTFNRPIVAVFDSGLTGCLFTKPFWDALSFKVGITNPGNILSIEVLKATQSHDKWISIQSDESKNPFYYVSLIQLDWFDDENNAPFVIVLGQTFLSQGILTIDIEHRKATFECPPDNL